MLRIGGRIVLASHNPGKVRELSELLAPLGIEVASAGDLGLPEPEETGETFRDNALLKARAAAEASGLPALADDSGLAVDALEGAPGIYSARWAGPEKDFAEAMERVHRELGERARTARFVCELALVTPDGEERTVRGEVEGEIVWPPRGAGGFGYDPLFQPAGYNTTFGEMTAPEKQQISHRARALDELKALLAKEAS